MIILLGIIVLELIISLIIQWGIVRKIDKKDKFDLIQKIKDSFPSMQKAQFLESVSDKEKFENAKTIKDLINE